MEAIAKTFTLLWKTRKGFEIRDMGDHRVMFVFPEASDIDRVLMGEPWTSDRHLVVLERMKRSDAIEEAKFNQTSFWVQVHDLPVRRSSLDVAMEIVSVMGRVDGRMSSEGGSSNFNFFRIRVSVDITKPLCRGRRIALASGKEGWVSFKYERLPNICYWCGRLTHSDRECQLWVKSRGTLKVENQQFGGWLRAVTPNMSRRTVIRVARLDEENNGDEDGQRNDSEGEEGDIRPGRRKENTAEDAMATRHGGADSDVSENINEGAAVTEIPLIPDSIKEGHLSMDIIPNSLAPLNSDINNQRVAFSAQLQDIDNEISKFDNVQVREEKVQKKVREEEYTDSTSNGLGGLQSESMGIGPEAVGYQSIHNVVKGEGLTQKRSWVRREQNRGEPSGKTSSVLKKRNSREPEAEDGITEGSRKKMTKEILVTSAEAGYQLRRDQ